MTREQALKIIELHGFGSQENTAFRDGIEIPGTSFDREVGIKAEYTRAEVYGWLGY